MHLRRADADYFARLLIPVDHVDEQRRPAGGFWTLHTLGVNPPDARTPVVLDVKAAGFVGNGAWKVGCPWCSSSQFGDPDSQDRFMCCDCGNHTVGHAWIGVEWPPEAAEIEEVLLRRGNPANMHWTPGEMIEELYAENIRHNLPGLIPDARRATVDFIVDTTVENPAHAIAPGTVVHPDSEWSVDRVLYVIGSTMGHSVSDTEAQAIRAVIGKGR